MVDAFTPFLQPVASAQIQATLLSQVVDSYLSYYASGRGHTARAKRLDLDHFLSFLASFHGVAKTDKLKVRDWDYSASQRFVDDLLARGEAPATVARRLATLKHMGRTLAEKVAGFINPAREVRAPRVSPLKPKSLSPREIAAVRSKAEERLSEKNSFVRYRNLVLFDFLLDTGLRADEVRLLKFAQMDERLQWVKNVRTKGRRYRNVYITSEMKPRLQRYLEERARILKRMYAKLSPAHNAALPLFISTYNAVPGKPESFLMGAKTIWRAMHELSVGTALHPHLLRHSYALDLLETSNDVRLVAQALGHSDVRITMRYTERKDEEVAAALEKSRGKKRLNASKAQPR
jgi:site-specific recombinase XerD